MFVSGTAAKVARVLCLTIVLLGAGTLYAQREREIQPPQSSQYGRRFFLQLRAIFGRFRDTDLRRVFDAAQPIQCSELINDPGEWRAVAFFNEKRELGDWYRSSLEEVKSDLSAFIFKGVCRGDRGSVALTTKFPVTEALDAYNHGRIRLDEIDVNVNAPVRAAFDEQTQAYSFDLPYLFLISQQGNENVYSLDPPRLEDREKYAADVINHWECKSVTAEAVTYQFLICHTMTLARDPRMRSQQRAAFGASAYFILSDGKEASSSVKLTFNDANDVQHTIEETNPFNTPDSGVNPPDAAGAVAWQAPDSDERIVDLTREGFRIRFSSTEWRGRIGSGEVLAGQKLLSLSSAQPPAGADFCIWLPGTPSSVDRLLSDSPEESVEYSATAHDREGQTSTSIVFDMKTGTGVHLGSLQCIFPRQSFAASVAFNHWTAIVGSYLTLEVRP
jgi:hypothetical protein